MPLTQGPRYPMNICLGCLSFLHVQENDKLVEEVYVPHQPDRMVQDASLGKGLQSPGNSHRSLRGSDEPLLYLNQHMLYRERTNKYRT
jgi:hypothetical protein